MSKLTINTIVGIYDKSKDGKAFITKTNKPYKKATVKYTETGDKMVTMPVWSGNQEPKVGDVVQGEITERDWQGKKYYDFKADKKEDETKLLTAQFRFSIARVDARIDEIQEFLRSQYPQFSRKSMQTLEEPTFEVNNAPYDEINGMLDVEAEASL